MRQHLFIDADDTLWENNVFFERAFDSFASRLAHSSMSCAEVRAALDGIEHVNNRVHGYGAANFARNLRQCFERLAERPVTDVDIAFIDEIGRTLAVHPIDLIDGVAGTVAALSEVHELTLFSKGDPAEQRAKIDRSGLGGYFHHTAIVREKDADTYRLEVAGRSIDSERCWMIGNSPKSDINPALEAGLGAVFVPNPNTWHLEKEEIRGGGRLLVVEKFADLLDHF